MTVITIHEGMLARSLRAHRYQPRNRLPQHGCLAVLPSADGIDDVALNMDLIEGRVRYRKGKKVRCSFESVLCAIHG